MLLLDTNVILRIGLDDGTGLGDGRVSSSGADLAEDAVLRGQAGMSVVSYWEMGVLASKQRLPRLDVRVLRGRISRSGLAVIPLDEEIAVRAATLDDLDFPVDDPADRFITATAMALGADLLTTDAVLLEWDGPISTIDARA